MQIIAQEYANYDIVGTLQSLDYCQDERERERERKREREKEIEIEREIYYACQCFLQGFTPVQTRTGLVIS